RAIGDQEEKGTAIDKIASIYDSLEAKQKSLEYYHQALLLHRVVGDREGEAIILGNMGGPYDSLGEYQKALDSYNQALPIYRAFDDRRRIAITLNKIGTLYRRLEEKQKALEYYNQALALSREVKDRRGEAVTLKNIGSLYDSLGEKQKALEFHDQALQVNRTIGSREGEAPILNSIGVLYDSLGEKQKALDYYNQAVQLWRTLGNRLGEATALDSIGSFYDSIGEKQKALEYFNQALPLWRDVGDRQGEATTLLGIARITRDRDNLTEARSHIEAALKINESIRTKIASPELRASYFTLAQTNYELYVDLLMRLDERHPSRGYDRAALEASERARARSLLEMLTEARADIRQGADPALLEQERSLLGQLNAAIERRVRLLSRKHPKEEAAAAGKKIDALTTEYEQVQAQIRLKSPRYAALTQPSPLSLNQVQQLLDPSTVLLEYSLGRERSFLWLVTSTSMASFALPKRKEIEAAVKDVL